MKTAVMQPYFLPYIGYFQLIFAVDAFVVFDDVNFIKKGWINRNRILLNNKPHFFTLPLSGASQNQLINEIELVSDNKGVKKKLDMIYHAYRKAPCFEPVYQLLKEILLYDEINLSMFIVHSLEKITDYLDIDTEFLISTTIKKDSRLKNQEKIIDICKKVGGTHYINPIGGVAFYHNELFQKNDIKLRFLKTGRIEYRQFGENFVPDLSIIDVLMFNDKHQCKKFLKEYTLISN